METKVLRDKSSKNFVRVCGYQVTAARYKILYLCMFIGACAVRDVSSMLLRWGPMGKKHHTHPAVSILLAVGNVVLNFIFVLGLTLFCLILNFLQIIVFTRPDSRRQFCKRAGTRLYFVHHISYVSFVHVILYNVLCIEDL